MENHYNLIVIGGGPGGTEAAACAAEHGMKTALIERDAIGGTCLNRGCIPTKTLLHSASFMQKLRGALPGGIYAEGCSYDMGAMQDRKDEVVSSLREGSRALLKKKKVDIIEGTGTILPDLKVQVGPGISSSHEETFILSADNILIASGSVPSVPPIPGADGDGVFTSDTLLMNRDKLSSLVIIGGGVIGMEFAGIYSDLGCEVTVIEALDKILANLDREFGTSLKQLMKKRGVTIHTGAQVRRIEDAAEKKRCVFSVKGAEESVTAEAVLIAAGRKPYTAGLLGEGTELSMERGFILTDKNHCTSLPHVYAVGDAAGGIQLAHAASAAGVNAVCHMLGIPPVHREDVIPSCVYTEPEIASVGMTKEEAKEAGYTPRSAKYPMSANGKSVLTGAERGFIKVVSDEQTGKVLGAQMMCSRATDMIAAFATAITNDLTIEDMKKAVYPHPSFSEGIMEALKL